MRGLLILACILLVFVAAVFTTPLLGTLTAALQSRLLPECRHPLPPAANRLVWAVTNLQLYYRPGHWSCARHGYPHCSPRSTVNYTMTASTPYGSVTATAVVTLNGQSAMGLPVISHFYANPQCHWRRRFHDTILCNVPLSHPARITDVGGFEGAGPFIPKYQQPTH